MQRSDSAFERYGGLPRYLFEFKDEDRRRKLEVELSKVTPTDLNAIFKTASYVKKYWNEVWGEFIDTLILNY